MKIKKNSSLHFFVIVLTAVVLGSVVNMVSRHPNSYADSSSIDIHKAIQETAYSYYMHSPYFSYASQQANPSYISPEEATSQNMNHITCSAVVKNIYNDLLGVKIPPYTDSLLNYGEQFIGNPEVVMFGKTNDGQKEIQVYDKNLGTSVTLDNPTSEQLLQYLEVGDILVYTGHAIMVYDLIRDGDNNVVDAKLIESSTSGGYYIKTKVQGETTIGTSINIGHSNPHRLYYGTKQNLVFADGRLEGGIRFSKFSEVNVWKNISSSNKKRYTILRFLTNNDEGDIILTYHGNNFSENNYNGVKFTLPQKTLDRLKFHNLFIEKTVDVFMDSIVEPGNQLTYKIIIQNNSDANYTEDLHVYENLSPYVDYVSYQSNKDISLTEQSDEHLVWNIGKLASGEEIVINYTVTAKSDSLGETITSTGMVESIPSAVISNKISQNPTATLASDIESLYDELKDTYAGKQLINEIYLRATETDLGLTSFDITELVSNSNKASKQASTIKLNSEHALYDAVLNQYWSSMYEKKYSYKGEDIYDYDMKLWRPYGNKDRRADSIYNENLKTGDILIYTNHDDVTYAYSSETDAVTKTIITNENGEYAYIYIEGRGFVGVNLGADGISGTIDDRNSFTSSYYTDNGLKVYTKSSETDQDVLDFLNYQTLLGKNYYVILRPSMILDLSSADDPSEEPSDNQTNKEEPSHNQPNEEDSLAVPNTGAVKENAIGGININFFSLAIVAVLFFTPCFYRRIKSHKVSFKK